MIANFPTYRDYYTGKNQNPRAHYETYIHGKMYEEDIEHIGRCYLWLHKNTEFNLGTVSRFRETKMLIYKAKDLHPGYAGVFLCDNNAGNEFLRDMENDAHDRWIPNIHPTKRQEARDTLSGIDRFIQSAYYKYSGMEQKEAFNIDSLDKLFSFDEVKEKPGKSSVSGGKQTKRNEPHSRDRVIAAHKFNTTTKDGKHTYTLEFNATESKENQVLKVFIGTDSSRDRINVLSAGKNAKVTEDGLLIMDVKKGRNIIEYIELDSPFLVAPLITT